MESVEERALLASLAPLPTESVYATTAQPPVNVLLDYGNGTASDDFATRLNELTVAAGIDPPTAAEIASVKAAIKSGLEAAYAGFNIAFVEAPPTGDFETIKYGVKLSDVPNSIPGSYGQFQTDWLNQDHNGTGWIFTADMLNDAPNPLPPITRAELFSLLDNVVVHTSVHELGHGLGLNHQDAWGDPAITPANYANTGGVQNTHYMASFGSGLSFPDFVSGAPFAFSQLERTKLLFFDGLTPTPVSSQPEDATAHDSAGTAQGLVLTDNLAGLPGVSAANVHMAEIAQPSEVDFYSVYANAGDRVTANTIAFKIYQPPTENNFNTFLQLYKADGTTVLAQNDDTHLGDDAFDSPTNVLESSPDSMLLNYVAPETGLYYLAVSATYGDGPNHNYDLFVTVAQDQSTTESTTTTVGASVNPAVMGQEVTFTATVSVASPGVGMPTGSVSFSDGSTSLGSGTLSDVGGVATATFSTSSLAVGNHAITASYSGDGNFSGSNGSLTETVTNTQTKVTRSPSTSVYGQSVSFTAVVRVSAGRPGVPTGSVDFFDQTANKDLGSIPLRGGKAKLVTASLAAGQHTILASYTSNSGKFGNSQGSLSQTVNPAMTKTKLTSSRSSSVFGQSVTFVAAISVKSPGRGMPAGSVNFFDQTANQDLGTVSLVNGQARLTTASLAAGKHAILATYTSDSGNFGNSRGSLSRTVNPAQTRTRVAASANPSVVGQPVTFTAVLSAVAPGSGTPTGSVNFFDRTTKQDLGTVPLVDGQASLTTASLAIRKHTIQVTYTSDTVNFRKSQGSLSQTVQPATTQTRLSSRPSPLLAGQAIRRTASGSFLVTAAGSVAETSLSLSPSLDANRV